MRGVLGRGGRKTAVLAISGLILVNLAGGALAAVRHTSKPTTVAASVADAAVTFQPNLILMIQNDLGLTQDAGDASLVQVKACTKKAVHVVRCVKVAMDTFSNAVREAERKVGAVQLPASVANERHALLVKLEAYAAAIDTFNTTLSFGHTEADMSSAGVKADRAEVEIYKALSTLEKALDGSTTSASTSGALQST